MKYDQNDKRKTNALIKILEGEVALLQDVIDEATHWNRPNDARGALRSIQNKVAQIAQVLNISLSDN